LASLQRTGLLHHLCEQTSQNSVCEDGSMKPSYSGYETGS
jgi:hypothetical protein